ncbi:zinc finger protein VAR3, chloroplastic isoform X2 [Abrus precatorius]|uniref:Zinc finger protein VAR3, chloroplastic isoform X2 n=1 Tax=Abrus precatorius TaxID=3816 RepID=A0A8B8LPS8_ABRPR|nr:zinc finger protein VAR3, chloroplastic isoform X2 [Abrus precatorius]
MLASKITLYGIGNALFRTPRTSPVTAKPLFVFFKAIPFLPPRRASSSSFCSSAAAAETLSSVDHPWPEWLSFVDRLNSKGYLAKPSSDDSLSVYTNINLLKDACLSFGRDRYDLFKLLPMNDIQAVVEGGCPNIFRKTVNSAKRLRAHLHLDEGDVCSACNLRSSCDRAYVILKDFETDARTVDLVRILLFYALDPLVLSGGDKPPGQEVIESSARKLLSQLIELSELSSAPAPAPSSACSKLTAQDTVAKGHPISVMTKKLSKDVEMKKGDWMCSKCNFMNFARNMQCLNCSEDKPKDIGLPTVEMKEGDWICPECNFLNFSRNTRCLKCKREGPTKTVNKNEVERKKGDWTCPQCGFMNFASKVKCLRCLEPNPSPKTFPGDWSCSKCNFYNYARNMACLKCNTERPKEQPTSGYEDHVWRRSN